MKVQWRYRTVPFTACYGPEEGGDGGGGNDGGAGGEGGGGEGGSSNPSEGGSPKSYSEAEYNTAMASLRKKHDAEKRETIARLKELEAKHNGSEEVRKELAQKIADMEDSLMTAEQRASKAQKEAESKYQQELKARENEIDSWRTRYATETNNRALTDAAIQHGALRAEQIISMFGPSTELVEDTDDDGKGTGSFTPMLTFTGLNDDKKPERMTMPVSEAFEKIVADGLNDNLFGNKAVPGRGTGPSSGSSSGKTGARPVRDNYSSDAAYTAAYAKYRESHDPEGNPIS